MGLRCERCSQCCSDPTLIVTITHRDLLRLEFFLPEIDLFKIVAFYQLKNGMIWRSMRKIITPSRWLFPIDTNVKNAVN